jgi:putative inorganic carbon (HCO3(-)) transporter
VSAPVSITLTQVGLALAACGAAWECVRGRSFPRTALDAPVLALLGVTLLSALVSDAPGAAARRFTGSWVTLALYLTAGWLDAPPRLERFLRLLLPTAVVFGAYGILQHFTGWNLFGGGGGALATLELGGRATYLPRGGFNHYQTYANVYFILFCLAFALAAGSSGRTRTLRSAAAGLLGVVVLLSFTRGIWLALIAALGLFGWIFARRALPAIGGLTAGLVLLALLVPSNLRTRALSMTDAESNIERLLLWETTWNMLRDRPLLGVGIGNYRGAQEAYVREEVPLLMTRTHAHNVWLQAAAERGVLGMLALLWVAAAVLGAAIRALRRLAPAGGLPHALAAGALAALTGFFLDGLVQNNFGDSQVALLFWLVAGVVVVCGRAAAAPAGRAAAEAC